MSRFVFFFLIINNDASDYTFNDQNKIQTYVHCLQPVSLRLPRRRKAPVKGAPCALSRDPHKSKPDDRATRMS